MSAGLLAPTRNNGHYWDTIIFQVQDELFKVPTYLLQKEEDSAFAGMLKLPQGGLNPEGSTDANPIRLDSGVTKVDFARLLDVMYPITVPIQYDTISKAEWISVLKLSDKFQLLTIRQLAVETLTESSTVKLSSAEMIRFGRQFSIGDWVIKGYMDLMRRPEPMGLEETELVGWETVAKISIQREKLIRASANANRHWQMPPPTTNIPDSEARRIIESEFEEELAGLGYHGGFHGLPFNVPVGG
ncbi:hypothetical protein C8J56DRAFT_925171 [Mycena floridula]|nr:hypothetical protein C8J56DRAFT_925171 [Mycena floridula]